MGKKSGLESTFGVAITESEYSFSPDYNRQLNIKIGFYIYQVPRLSKEQLTVIRDEIDKFLKENKDE